MDDKATYGDDDERMVGLSGLPFGSVVDAAEGLDPRDASFIEEFVPRLMKWMRDNMKMEEIYDHEDVVEFALVHGFVKADLGSAGLSFMCELVESNNRLKATVKDLFKEKDELVREVAALKRTCGDLQRMSGWKVEAGPGASEKEVIV